MKKLLISIVVIGTIGFLGWGVGGCGGGSSITNRSEGDLSGTYSLQETSCDSIVESFQIEQSEIPEIGGDSVDATITITNDGRSALFDTGDVIRNASVYMDRFGVSGSTYVPAISSSSFCTAFLVTDETLSDYEDEAFAVSSGDLWTQCNFGDGLCMAVFR